MLESITYCEVCGEPLSMGDPGAVFLIWDDKHRPGESVPLHSEECRAEWFTDYPPRKWIVDHRVKDLI